MYKSSIFFLRKIFVFSSKGLKRLKDFRSLGGLQVPQVVLGSAGSAVSGGLVKACELLESSGQS